MPSEEEINEVLDKCAEADMCQSQYPGMSFEAGVRYAIEFMQGGDSPFEE